MAMATKTKKAAKPPVVTACVASTLGETGLPPVDRPEWLIEGATTAQIKDVLKALCAPHPLPKGNHFDVTVDGTDVRLIALPPYKGGPPADWEKRLAAWWKDLQPLIKARGPKLVGAIHITQVPKNLKFPSEELRGVGGWLRSISKELPLYIDPMGYIEVYTAKDAFPDGMNRRRTMWTLYRSIKLSLADPARGRNEIWQQILLVARAP